MGCTPAGTNDNTSLRKAERGVSILEFAILVPVIIIIVAGIVDYGFALREIQAISGAAREGARTAASHSRVHVGVGCGLDANAELSYPCEKLRGAFTVGVKDPVSEAGQKATCGLLSQAGLKLADWKVTTSIPSVPLEGTWFDTVKIRIERSPTSGTQCVLCWENLLAAFKPSTVSTFNLESNCRAHTP